MNVINQCCQFGVVRIRWVNFVLDFLDVAIGYDIVYRYFRNNITEVPKGSQSNHSADRILIIALKKCWRAFPMSSAVEKDPKEGTGDSAEAAHQTLPAKVSQRHPMSLKAT